MCELVEKKVTIKEGVELTYVPIEGGCKITKCEIDYHKYNITYGKFYDREGKVQYSKRTYSQGEFDKDEGKILAQILENFKKFTGEVLEEKDICYIHKQNKYYFQQNENYYIKCFELTIPEKIDELTVLEIGNSAFSGCKGIRELKLGDKIKKVGKYAFNGNSKLQKIDGLAEVEEIEESAFSMCGIVQMNLPNLGKIGRDAFEQCKQLTQINCPRVEKISGGAFFWCEKLMQINCPRTVSIGNRSFSGCKELVQINCKSVEEIGIFAFENCDSLKQEDCLNAKIKEAVLKNVAITTSEDSEVAKLAQKNGIPVSVHKSDNK